MMLMTYNFGDDIDEVEGFTVSAALVVAVVIVFVCLYPRC